MAATVDEVDARADAAEEDTGAGSPPAAEPPPAAAGMMRRNLDLVTELAITQFRLRYTGSALGYLWSLFKPALLFGLMYVIFVDLFHVGDTTPYFAIQLLLGIVLWTFFSECTAFAMHSIASSGHLIRKAYFPRFILVVAASLTTVFTFAINLALVVVVALLSHQMDLSLRILWVVPLLVELYVLALGVSLFLAALFVQFRDVGHLWEVISQVLFYGSAVVYPLSILTHKYPFVLRIASCNPVAQIIQDMRHAVVTPQAPWIGTLVGPLVLVPIAISLIALGIGALTFRRLSPHFAENL